MSKGEASMTSNSWLRYAPFLVFAALAGVFGAQLYTGRAEAPPSALIDKPTPEFDLPRLLAPEQRLTSADLATGGPVVVNLWASWCGPCRIEHPDLMKLAASGKARVFGFNHKDDPANAKAFLEDLGNPFEAVAVDQEGLPSLRWGVTGLPETFILDGDGRIVYKHIGPIQNNDLEKVIYPAIEAARAR